MNNTFRQTKQLILDFGPLARIACLKSNIQEQMRKLFAFIAFIAFIYMELQLTKILLQSFVGAWCLSRCRDFFIPTKWCLDVLGPSDAIDFLEVWECSESGSYQSSYGWIEYQHRRSGYRQRARPDTKKGKLSGVLGDSLIEWVAVDLEHKTFEVKIFEMTQVVWSPVQSLGSCVPDLRCRYPRHGDQSWMRSIAICNSNRFGIWVEDFEILDQSIQFSFAAGSFFWDWTDFLDRKSVV